MLYMGTCLLQFISRYEDTVTAGVLQKPLIYLSLLPQILP